MSEPGQTDSHNTSKNNSGKQLGALDLGSNSFHLLIAQENRGRIQILDKHKEMVRLAEGLDDRNRLSEVAIQRALECLERSAQRLRSVDPENVRVVGTNTLRKASNAGEFIKLAQQTLGYSIEIISGREEARLIFLGVNHDLGGDETRRLIC
ncbi:MAG: exopolyphosphatase, partial [Pseudomonadota bacterium]